jgi:hypothetical protein
MALESLQQASRLEPPRPHRWLGEGEQPQLSLLDQAPVRQPLRLVLAGRDRRGLALRPSRWHWDPRPRLLAVVPVAKGEQLQLRDHDGRWLPLSPVWPRLQSVEPQGDGSGVAFSGEDAEGTVSIWRVGLRQPGVVPADAAARLACDACSEELGGAPTLVAGIGPAAASAWRWLAAQRDEYGLGSAEPPAQK